MGIITARKRSCGKVMFLQVSVILSTGGGVLLSGGVSYRGSPIQRGISYLGGLSYPGGGMPACTWATLYKQLHSWWVSVGVEAVQAVRILLECILVG